MITKLKAFLNLLGWHEWYQVVEIAVDGSVKPVAIRGEWYTAHVKACEMGEKEGGVVYGTRSIWLRLSSH